MRRMIQKTSRAMGYLAALLLLLGCGKTEEAGEKAGVEVKKTASQAGTGETARLWRDFDVTFAAGAYQARVVADEISLKGDSVLQRFVVRNGLQVQFWDEKGKELCIAKAIDAFVMLPLERVDVIGEMLVKTHEGYEIVVTNLNWNVRANRIFAPGRVEIKTPKAILMGDSLEASLDFSYFRIGKVTGGVDLE
ncbi:MAG: hypothetical protein AAF570_25795 [Bacteroidota bacterium]